MDEFAIKALRKLKERHNEGVVSALVGAGFSKNIDAELFPPLYLEAGKITLPVPPAHGMGSEITE